MNESHLVKKLNTLVNFVWNNPYTDLYRSFWQKKSINAQPTISSLADWKQIPFSDRSLLSAVENPDQRVFIEKNQTDMLYSTSGTSTGKPLFFWRSFPKKSSYHEVFFKQGTQRILLLNAYDKINRTAIPHYQVGIKTLLGDPHNLKRAAMLAQKGLVDTISGTPTLVGTLGEYLKQAEYIQHIKVVFLWGEYCSQTTYDFLKTLYPQAFFLFGYGQSEAGGITMVSTQDCSYPNQILHVYEESYFFEVVDNELVVNTLSIPDALPLIRYKTGDEAQLVDEACPCGNSQQRIKVLGRINGDFVRFSGGEIRVEELERVMEPLLPFVEKSYTLEIDEVTQSNKKIGILTLLVTKKEGVTTPDDSLRMHIARTLEESMRLSQNMRIKDAIKAGFLGPLVVRMTPESESGMKNKKLVRKFV